jgi:hypothetical protein
MWKNIGMHAKIWRCTEKYWRVGRALKFGAARKNIGVRVRTLKFGTARKNIGVRVHALKFGACTGKILVCGCTH